MSYEHRTMTRQARGDDLCDRCGRRRTFDPKVQGRDDELGPATIYDSRRYCTTCAVAAML